MEMATFTCFLLIQIAAKTLPTALEKFSHLVFVQRIANNHWLVWFAHPVVVHSLHEYSVHFIIYSGYVLRGH